MSGFEHYEQELTNLDREIMHHAAVSGIDINNPEAVKVWLAQMHGSGVSNKTREAVRGLLVLRLKVEAEMLAAGQKPKELGDW